ncbi:MAG: preprotein translocase subunit SecA [Alphaproteobacteria bacterium]|nr:MAG: preprotein translocase subunit SecA [Alphaproteobacteria bacterium]TAF14797.1 MAG: preprotein translocase subunit SecA [Alphaproteobacteria bacterium]TAF40546.1 MAG: preprotein translocase subunit SecA [Alphaproteobacteria bacterium]
MVFAIAKKIFGSANDRLVKGYRAKVAQINAMEAEYRALTDEALRGKTEAFRARYAAGESLDALLPEAFATVREASSRVMQMRHYDVQLIGGMVLHEGRIAEMKTGEGKTLVATLAVYLNALTGGGVHVVTVNDYLAQRDAGWMGRLYQYLGLTVGVIVHGLDDSQRRAAYDADITYGTNNEFGFDYLRDNMKFSRQWMVQRPFAFAVVDEVDSILIDEARTPLIISGPTENNSALYMQIGKLIPHLTQEHVEIDEKSKNITLTEEGTTEIERLLVQAGMMQEGDSLYDLERASLVHHVQQALKAYKLFQADVDYIVKDGKVMLIDEFTGRMMEGRRLSEGLHQAIEAKEGVRIQNENQTLASITFQNYFRLYPKLAGMTGTALTEANEFSDIYKLEVVEIPTHVAVARLDANDEIYRTMAEKTKAVVEEIKLCYERGQPVLVGTVSIEKSEYFSKALNMAKIPHQVLNARHHEQEAHIIAQAGRFQAVTIATNMAGRGTDIKLGGNVQERIASETQGLQGEMLERAIARIEEEVRIDQEKVLAAGGLYVIGTERHESRRIDNQLRGRSGRQGDRGASKFFISLEDDLMRIFGSERMDAMLQRFGLKEGEAITHPWMNKALERAQAKVEARNYDIRKNLLRFDDVMNDQRKVIYEQRLNLMEAEDVVETVLAMREDTVTTLVATYMPIKAYADQWDLVGLHREIYRIFGLDLPIKEWATTNGVGNEEMIARLHDAVSHLHHQKELDYGADIMRMVEKRILLETLDQLWKDHLLSLDHLRAGIGLRAYAQRDPLNEYKQEAFGLFEYMLDHLRETVTIRLAHIVVHVERPPEAIDHMQHTQIMQELREDLAFHDEDDDHVAHIVAQPRDPLDPSTWGRVGRNEPCPCGSGKKYKHCHGVLS